MDGRIQWLLAWLPWPLQPPSPPPDIPTPVPVTTTPVPVTTTPVPVTTTPVPVTTTPQAPVPIQLQPIIVNPPGSKGGAEVWAQPVATGLAAAGVIAAAGITMLVAYFARRQLSRQFKSSRELEILRGLRDRYTAIGTQIADPSVTVRIAGVFALAALADDWIARSNHREVQACIDVLCSYLRSPYSPPVVESSSNLVKTTIREKSGGSDIEKHYEHRQDDNDVRKIILALIGGHTVADANPSWSDYQLNLSGAFIDTAAFSDCVFRRPIIFGGATFAGDMCFFTNATFNESVWFDDAVFSTSEEVLFDKAKFLGSNTSFANATFSAGFVDFKDAVFESNNVVFADVTWSVGDLVSFKNITISESTKFESGAKPSNVEPDVWPPVNAAPTGGSSATGIVAEGDHGQVDESGVPDAAAEGNHAQEDQSGVSGT